MRGRLYLSFTAVTLALLLPGCVQATRHSNTMLFGTNTKFGLSVGTTPANIPEINVGYSRQEAVVLPLVANIADNGNVQTPCDMSRAVTVPNSAKFAVHPCSLVAIKGEAMDSYSVLASFGAQFDGSTQPGAGQVKGGLAQYFATGMAAQLLALTGGASVVSVGAAAVKAAEEPQSRAAEIKALFGGDSVFAAGQGLRSDYDAFRDRLLAKILLTDPANISQKIKKFETDAGAAGNGVAADCTSVEACQKAVIDNTPYLNDFDIKKSLYQKAFNAWSIP